MNVQIVDYDKKRTAFEDYHETGGASMTYAGFECFKGIFQFAMDGVTDITGLPACFCKGQLIHTDKGIKPIEEIEIGDKVLSYDIESKVNEYKEVTDTPSNNQNKQKLYLIKLKDGTEIKVTENHRFWTGDRYLQIKDILVSLPHKKK
jgi:hypothetical protein